MIFGGIRKVPTECPHCGFTQQEPAGLISTYCRGCGDHYTVAGSAASPLRPKPSISGRVREKLLPREPRTAVCHECGYDQKVPPHAQNTACQSCGCDIHFQDMEILGHSTRVVQTHGTVHVGRDGFLNSTRIVCGNAIVEGRIAGKVTCEGTVRLKGGGVCRAQVTARQLIVDRGATLRFTSTIHAGEIVIRGRLDGDVECSGTLHIGRYGGLEGAVQARAMTVDKGGYYAGEVQVTTSISRPDTLMHEEAGPRVWPAWQTHLAFG